MSVCKYDFEYSFAYRTTSSKMAKTISANTVLFQLIDVEWYIYASMIF